MSVSRWLLFFICCSLYKFSFAAIYSCCERALPLPAVTGLGYLDDGLHEVDGNVEIIQKFRRNEALSFELKDFLKKDLNRAVELFRPQIELQPNFLSCEPYWRQLQKQINELIEEDALDLPLMHIIGLKLILLKDLSQLSTKENSNIFLYQPLNRTEDEILKLTDRFLGKFSRFSYESIAQFLEHPLKNAQLFVAKITHETIPLFSDTGIFGLNPFFFAFFNMTPIQTYPATANRIVHAGRFNTYKGYFEHLHYQKNPTQRLYLHENFYSSILVANHDRLHTYRYELTFNDRSHGYLLQWFRSCDQSTPETDQLAELILLFFVCHELECSIAPDDIFHRIQQAFPDYNEFIKCCSTEAEQLNNVHHHQQRALEKIDDFASFLSLVGSDICYNKDEPWKNGPEVVRVFKKYLYNAAFFLSKKYQQFP